MANLTKEETYCVLQRGKHVRVRITNVIHIGYFMGVQTGSRQSVEYAIARVDNGRALDKHRKASDFMCAGKCCLSR